jgi:hypothetical protein
MLGMFLRCPAQFEFRYIRGVIIPPGVAARVGSGVHEAAHINNKQKITSRQDLPASDLQDAARDHYVKLVKEKGVFIPKDQAQEKNKILNMGLNSVVSLTKLYHTSLAPQIQPVMAEDRLEVEVGLAWPISGGIDAYTEDKWLSDLKTAAKSKHQVEADNSLQLTFYAGLLAHTTGEWPERVSLEVLVNTKKPKHQSLISRRGPQDWANLMLRLKLMEAQILTGLFPPCDPGAWNCSVTWCGYYAMCKFSSRR